MDESQRIDEEVNDSFDLSSLMAYSTNLKRFVDDYANRAVRGLDREQELQDALLQAHLRYTDDAHGVIMRLANAGAGQDIRLQANTATVDNLAALAALTNPAELAETAIGAKVAGEVRSASKEAIEAALANVAQTSAAAQGSTGTAQAGIQAGEAAATVGLMTNMAEVVAALGAQLAKLSEVADVLLIRVTGDAAVEDA
jgi:hypothetical protein